MLNRSNEEATIPGFVCTIRNPKLANGLLVGLVAVSLAAAIWLLSAMFAGPWLADTIAVEATISGITILAFALSARLLARALGCGRCGTPQCTCH